MLIHLGRLAAISAMALGVIAATPSANATVFNFFDVLNGGNEVPPNGSTALGTLVATYDDVSKIFSFTYDLVSPLTSPLVNGHIHGPGAVGVNAPIIIDLLLLDDAGAVEAPGPFPQLPTYTATLDMDSPGAVALLGATGQTTASFEAFLLSELLYLNLHTEAFADGEARAQFLLVDQVPEPATLALLGLGLIGLGAARLRRA